LRGMGGEIPRLYASQFEANSILGLTTGGGGLMAVGFEASRSLAMSSVLSRYRIIHFAAHGVLNEEHPELSGIVLSMVDRFGHPQDGILRLHDIYNLDLPVDLVVLSACNTAQGKEIKGEGLIGLTRGFMYAGAAGVVASLWKVDDEATAELMTGFYRGLLQEKLSAPAALRQAQLAMASQPRWRSPYFWAGFVIQGKYTGSELYNNGQGRSTRSLSFLTIGTAALLFCGLLLLKKRRHGAGRSSA
jgi:CHAT domain-containing protein